MHLTKAALGVFAAAAVAATAPPAEAYSTRMHIVIANEVRKELIAGGGTSVALKFGEYTVVLSQEDAEAINSNPLEFRAGAIGPDNMAFPGMTDPSHAVGQRPFEQCQLLYEEALLPEERAYAMGCFLHGSTDAVAHHYVNYLTGETFTLNPITNDRQFDWSNVVRHITAESMIQDAAFTLSPELFSGTNLSHKLPKGFIQRAYLDESSALWQMMSAHARGKLEAAQQANPGDSLITVLPKAGLAAADHLVLSPLYLREIDDERKAVKTSMENRIAELQNPGTADGATLGVTAGTDGKLGTEDDATACTATCPTLYSTYKVYVAMLAPRFDAGNNPLPSAFDKISDELKSDLYKFLPAYLDTVENLSSKLNEPLTAGSDGFTITKSDVATLAAPMTQWANDITSIDYATLTQTLLPSWLLTLQNALNAVGVNIQVPSIVKALLDPVVTLVKDAVKVYVIDEATKYVEDLTDQYKQSFSTTKGEFETRLQAATPPGASGTILQNFWDSGLWGHSFNVAATAIAKHEAVLPVGNDPIGIGPATFDASYTVAWMQIGVCSYLRDAVFPLGIDAAGSLSLYQNGSILQANIADNAAVECHDGSLSSFTATPGIDNCLLVDVDGLVVDPQHKGSVSRAYPPDFGTEPATCTGLAVQGLPDPPPGTGGSGGGSGNGGNGGSPLKPATTSSDDGGCGCRVQSRNTDPKGMALLLLLGALLASRRRRRRAAKGRRAVLAGAGALALVVAGCGSDGGGGGGGTGAFGGGGAAGAGTGGGSGGLAGAGTGGTAGTAGFGGLAGTGGGTGGSAGLAQQLLQELGNSVWSAKQMREGKERVIEVQFDASQLFWAEIRNPYGPARKRTMRVMQVDQDGKTVYTTITVPAGWPSNPDNGKKETFTVEVLPGPPKQLRITSGGTVETFDEGAWPEPSSGLTAVVRVFQTGGSMDQAFCAASSISAPNRVVIWEFARGASAEQPLGEDIVAGAKLTTWTDPTAGNNFAVTDVDGFDLNGGTLLSDQNNFIVLYLGSISHPGGSLGLREKDDDVKDAIWAFLGGGVGSSNSTDVFLEVHGHIPADLTADAPSSIYPSGDVEAEFMVLRCNTKIQDIDIEVNQGSGWGLVGNASTKPKIDNALFPPAL